MRLEEVKKKYEINGKQDKQNICSSFCCDSLNPTFTRLQNSLRNWG